jgi:hypothetical protein
VQSHCTYVGVSLHREPEFSTNCDRREISLLKVKSCASVRIAPESLGRAKAQAVEQLSLEQVEQVATQQGKPFEKVLMSSRQLSYVKGIYVQVDTSSPHILESSLTDILSKVLFEMVARALVMMEA